MTLDEVTGAECGAATTGTALRRHPEETTIGSDQADSSPLPRLAGAGQRSAPEFDLLVVGGGSGGFAAAIAASEQGRRVGLVNTGPLGGTCTNRGCIPSKALIRTAEVWWRAGHHPYAGVDTAQVGLDWQMVQAQKDRLIGELRHSRYEDVLAGYPDITLLEGEAAFQPDGSVRVGERSVRARRYLVATGARPRVVPFPGLVSNAARA